MNITEFIKKLESMKEEYGDLEVTNSVPSISEKGIMFFRTDEQPW